MTANTDLASRILDAFPTGQYGLVGLLRVLDIVETTEVETAAIECRELPRMLVNRAFVDTFASTPETLLMLVLHELHHLLLGHTRLFKRPTDAHNFVFDAVINSMLCRMFPEPAYTAMFTGFYSDRRFPECFLRPPSGWRPGRGFRHPPALRGKDDAVRWAYSALYSEKGIGYEELFSQLAASLPIVLSVRLLGNHGPEPPELESSPALFEAVRSIVEHWPLPPQPKIGRSWADVLDAHKVQVAPRVPDREILTGLIQRIARDGARRGSRRGGWVEAVAPAPRPDRRSIVLRALGGESLLYRTESWSPRAPRGFEPVHVYLDVSGSVSQILPALYAAVCSCRDLLHPAIHLFSTRVHDLPISALRRGECRSTWGTDIGCVAEHIGKHRVSRALLVTDGCVGAPSGQHADALKRCLLAVALTPGYSLRADLEPYTRFFAQMKGTQ